MTRKEIINVLEEISDLMEFSGENPFKISAFKNGANTIRRFEGDFEILIEEKNLDSIKGIGKGLQNIIYEMFQSGNSSLLSELKLQIPETLPELFKVRGLGPKKIRMLYKELGIKSIIELERACSEGRLTVISGFTDKTEKKIFEEIEKIRENEKFVLIYHADMMNDSFIKILEGIDSIIKYEVSGEFRRHCEVISKLEYVVFASSAENVKSKLMNTYHNLNLSEDFIEINEFKIPILLHIVTSEDEFTSKLFVTTGSSQFIAIQNFEFDNNVKTEEDIFKSNKLPYHAPIFREKEYLDNSCAVKKITELVEEKDFHGFFHFHTTYSDGSNSLKEMVLGAKEKGYSYFVVCDHSKSAFYANGLTEERILLQHKEIKALSEEIKLPIFKGIEADILSNGDLDYSDDFLHNFDFVVASVHSRFNLNEDEMTKRIIRAVENPKTNLLGHPTGRLLLSRDPYQVNIKMVIEACSQNNVAIEINANPRRLDLDWRHIFYAREMGCKFSINQDAHSVDDIKYLKYGVWMAQKGGISSNEVINCYSLEEFQSYLKTKR
ncbi:MAG: PHP domain-containing protein [Ignavibacteria bacterium]|nr:PHP domain-containing protein [Ignavibacteria bacterium]